jgi:hypothetical protein
MIDHLPGFGFLSGGVERAEWLEWLFTRRKREVKVSGESAEVIAAVRE